MKEGLIKKVTLGCDPELFLFSPLYLKYVPVCGLIGGTKRKPLFFTDKGHAIQEDNVALEFCVPPANNCEEWLENIVFTKNYIKDTLLAPKELVPHYIGSTRFKEEDLDSPQAQHFGCDPDYNAYTFEPNVVNKTDKTLRTAGGHIHIGYENPTVDNSIAIIKAMDLFLGVESVLIDMDFERRKMYGSASCYRLKGFGVEYRSLSNFWLNSDELIKWAYNQSIKAVDFVNEGGIITNPTDIIRCINTSNKELAMEILEDYNIEVSTLKVEEYSF